jgi:murein lipoprotein
MTKSLAIYNLIFFLFFTGCASTAEIDALQGRIADLETLLHQANHETEAAQATASQAASQAIAADAAAKWAEAAAKQTNSKLDQIVNQINNH